MIIKKIFTLIWLTLILCTIIGLFWRIQWMYDLPAVAPRDFKAIPIGSLVQVRSKLQTSLTNKPVFLHFFNPDCACSRFNVPHFRTLVKKYGKQINFTIVVISKRKFTEKEIQDKFQLTIPVSTDSTLAAQCGVYSTPQAVLIDSYDQLYFRGNYNRSRYCSDNKTEYARIALNALLNQKSTVLFDQFALKAYGCQLPLCTREK